MSQQRANHFRRFAAATAKSAEPATPTDHYDLTADAVRVLITSFQNLEALMLPLFGGASSNFQVTQVDGSVLMFRPELPLHLSITPPSKDGDTLFEIARAQPDPADPHVSTSWEVHTYDRDQEKFDVTRTVTMRDRKAERSGDRKPQTPMFKFKEQRGLLGFEDLASDFISTSYSLLGKEEALALATALKNLRVVMAERQAASEPAADGPTAPGGVA